MGYVLGLDLGPTSVGWCAVRLGARGEFEGLLSIADGTRRKPAIGVRHFQINIKNFGSGKKERTRARHRREKRSQRRTTRRRKGRKKRLMTLLQKEGLLPSDQEQLCALMKENPYKLRTLAVKRRIHPHKIGRVLMHIAQRRGFKSNRKHALETDVGGSKKEMKAFEEAKEQTVRRLEGRTLGATLWHEARKNPRACIRNRAGQFNWVALRSHYMEEVRTIWETQGLPFPLLERILKNEGPADKEKLLFWQQDYRLSERKRSRLVGKCRLMPSKLRCSYASRKAQEFRMLQKVNDLAIRRGSNTVPLSPKQRRRTMEELSLAWFMTFDELRRLLGTEDRFNLEWQGQARLPGNGVDAGLCSLFGRKVIRSMPPDQRDALWTELLAYLESPEGEREDFPTVANEKYHVTWPSHKKLEGLRIPTGHSRYCREVLDELVHFMQDGTGYSEALDRTCASLGLKRPQRVLSELPVPDRAHGVEITNPVVGSCLHEVRTIVNGLLKELGDKPNRIVVELAREIKASKEHRQEIIAGQVSNQKERERVRGLVCEIRNWPATRREDVTEGDVERYRLWQQQKGRCIYSGKCIAATELFGNAVQVDHIIPSFSLDNSLTNKVVCFAHENQAKAQDTPISWLERRQPDKWEQLQQLIRHWKPKRKGRRGDQAEADARAFENCAEYTEQIPLRREVDKWKRFFVRNEEVREKYVPGNLLRDTTYIATAVREYLQRLYDAREAEDKVTTTKGGVTAELRRLWRLNSILGSPSRKNRSDLRHHAIDAAVVAVTEVPLIQRVTRAIQDAWPEKRYGRIHAPKAWTHFYDELMGAINNDVTVSHKVDHKVHGALLDEQPLGLSAQAKEVFKARRMKKLSRHAWFCAERQPYIRRRVPCDAIKRVKDLDRIPNESKNIRATILRRLSQVGVDIRDKNAKVPEGALEDLTIEGQGGKRLPVRKVRCVEERGNMVVITDDEGKPYKAYPSAENHHIEIFRHKDNGKVEFVCKVWSVFDVALRIKKKQPIILRKHPDAEFHGAEFIMSLFKGDSVILQNKGGEEVIARVEGISGNPCDARKIDIDLCEIQVGDRTNLDKKERSEMRQQLRIQSFRDFARRNVRKITVDPLGRVRWAEKKFWPQDVGAAVGGE